MAQPAIQFTADETSLLYRIARALLTEQEYGELLAGLLDAAIEALGADRGFVVVREDAAFRATVARNFRSEALAKAEEEVSSSISAAVVEQGRALLIGDALESEQFGENPSVRRLGLRSVLCAPLVASRDAFGLIYLENRDVTNRFTERHRRLLDEICALAVPRLRAAVAVTPESAPANWNRRSAALMVFSRRTPAWRRCWRRCARWRSPSCRS